jgi:hypothetical protein
MAKKTNTDIKTLELIQQVKKQKEEIAKAERPNWLTNCSWSYMDNSTVINLHVESNISNLIAIAAFLIQKEYSYNEAAIKIGIDSPPPFKWCGFSSKEWIEDVKMRINKIQIAAKRKKLEMLEERLNKIVSPELRAKLELEEIENALS